ncbi:hypothetical protein [Bradyrhizobium diazoefficiens]
MKTIEERRAQQIEHGAEQCEEQIAYRRAQGLRTAIQRDQRHRGECQQFQGNIKREEVSTDKDCVQRGPDRQQQDPEHEWRARLRRCHGEFSTGIDGDCGDHDCGRRKHHGRQSVRAQRHPQRRRPGAEQVNERAHALRNCCQNRYDDHQPQRDRRECDQPDVSLAQNEG